MSRETRRHEALQYDCRRLDSAAPDYRVRRQSLRERLAALGLALGRLRERLPRA